MPRIRPKIRPSLWTSAHRQQFHWSSLVRLRLRPWTWLSLLTSVFTGRLHTARECGRHFGHPCPRAVNTARGHG